MIAEERLGRAFLASHPVRAGSALGQMPAARTAAVLRTVRASDAAKVIRQLTVSYASDCLEQLAPTEAAAIVAALSSDDAAGIVRAVVAERREMLLAALSPDVRDPIARVLSSPEGTAGAVMDPSIFQLGDDVIVADARVRLARAARELLYYIYVVDQKQRLVGVLDIPELMLARARDRVSTVMHRDVDRLSVFLPVALVREHAGWQHYHAMPVVDQDDRLLGAIRYQTLRRLEREASGGGPSPAQLTAGALAELFQLGTSGLVAGMAATAAPEHNLDRLVDTGGKVPDAR